MYYLVLVIGSLFFLILFMILYTYIFNNYKGTLDNRVPGYLKFKMLNSPNHNIGTQKKLINNITLSSKYCDSLANCRAFNTQGLLKDKVESPQKWKIVPESSFNMYIKIIPRNNLKEMYY